MVSVWELPLNVSVVVSNVTVIAELAVKSEPLIATLVPGGPEAGDSAFRVGVAVAPVTVKVAVFTTPPTVTVIVWAPVVALAGMVMILAKLPEGPVCALPLGISVVLSNLKTIAVFIGKLLPVIGTGVLGGPEAGSSAPRVAGVVTVNVWVAVSVPAVTVMLCEPTVAVEGMVI